MKPKHFPLDLSKFKKVQSGEHATLLAHPDGHQIQIAHSSLSEPMKKQLAALPSVKMSEGGDVPDLDPEKAKQFVQGATASGWNPSGWMKNLKEGFGSESPKKMADGGQAGDDGKDDLSDLTGPNQSQMASNDQVASSPLSQSTQPTIIINNGQPSGGNERAGAPSAPPSNPDPMMNRKRELYNQMVSNHPYNPNAQLQGPQYFGVHGEAPQNFNPSVWQDVDQKIGASLQADQASQLEDIKKTTEENKVRAAAGVPLLPVPVGPGQNLSSPEAMQVQNLPNSQNMGQNQTQPVSNDPWGTQQYYQNLSGALGKQEAASYGAAQVLQKQGEAESQAAAQTQAQVLNLKQVHDDQLNDLLQEQKNVQHDVENYHLDPNRYINSMGAGSKVATAIGLILGGIGGGLTHQENPAMKFLNAQIDRDIQAQRDELGKKENLLSANFKKFGNLDQATRATEAMFAMMYGMQIQKAGADAKGPLAKYNAMQAVGQLQAQYAPQLMQIAKERTLQAGAQNGQIPPEYVIRGLVPEAQQQAYFKELQSAQNMQKQRDNALSAWDQVQKINTLWDRTSSPLQTPRQVRALTEPLLGSLTKETEGRVTPTDIETLRPLFPQPGDNDKTLMRKKIQFQHIFNQRMAFPMLQSIGINPAANAKYNPQGQKTFQLGPVVSQNGR